MPNNIELLRALMALNQGAPGVPRPAPSMPIPLAPQGPQGPIMNLSVAPDTPPVAPLPGADRAFIDRYSGPAPIAPAPRSKLDRILSAIGAFGAGIEGRGGEYLARLDEPRRRYEAQLEGYQDRRGRAEELDLRRREREQDAITRRAEAQSEKEFQQYVRAQGVSDSQAIEQLRFAHELQRDAIKLNAERVEQERRDKIAQQRDARQIEERYFTATKNRPLSKELGLYWSGIKDSISPAAAALDKRLQGIGDVRMSRAAGAGAGGRTRAASNAAQAALDRFNLARQAVIDAARRGDKPAEKAYREAMNRAFKSLARYPRDVRMFETVPGWPYAEMTNAPAPAQQQPQQPQAAPDPLGILR